MNFGNCTKVYHLFIYFFIAAQYNAAVWVESTGGIPRELYGRRYRFGELHAAVAPFPHGNSFTSALIRPDKDCHIDFTNVFFFCWNRPLCAVLQMKRAIFRFWEVFVMRIGFIGAGKVASALGLYFQSHGLDVAGYCSRTAASALRASGLTGTLCYSSLPLLAESCGVLFVTTPDSAIADVDAEAAALLRAERLAADKIWIHTSGALPSTELSQLASLGCAVGSLHPMQSFGEPTASAKMLEESYFTVEGSKAALETMREILTVCGARFDEIETKNKPLYHAGACVLSNYLVTLLDSGFSMLRAAGLRGDAVFDAALPLLEGTLQNVRQKGTAEALTGPIARGDLGTVDVHLRALDAELPERAPLYRALGLATVEMEEGKKLGREQAAEFKYRLRGGNYGE